MNIEKKNQLDTKINTGYNLLSYSKDIKKKTIDFSYELNEENIRNNFEWLEQGILDNQRIVSGLDFYKISDSVNQDNVESVFNNMIRNTSAIVIDSCILNGVEYTIGDLIYKQANGQPLPLKLGSGTYYPRFSENNTKITWTYTNKIPTANSTEDPKIEYSLELQPEGNLSYSEIIMVNDKQTDIKINKEIFKTDDNYPVVPIIKGYHKISKTIPALSTSVEPTVDSNCWEEIIWDYIIEEEEEGEDPNKKSYWHIKTADDDWPVGLLDKIVVK